jgi:hypothetical protein
MGGVSNGVSGTHLEGVLPKSDRASGVALPRRTNSEIAAVLWESCPVSAMFLRLAGFEQHALERLLKKAATR